MPFRKGGEAAQTGRRKRKGRPSAALEAIPMVQARRKAADLGAAERRAERRRQAKRRLLLRAPLGGPEACGLAALEAIPMVQARRKAADLGAASPPFRNGILVIHHGVVK